MLHLSPPLTALILISVCGGGGTSQILGLVRRMWMSRCWRAMSSIYLTIAGSPPSTMSSTCQRCLHAWVPRALQCRRVRVEESVAGLSAVDPRVERAAPTITTLPLPAPLGIDEVDRGTVPREAVPPGGLYHAVFWVARHSSGFFTCGEPEP